MFDPEALEGHVAEIERDGYTIVEGAIETDLVDALLQALPLMETVFDVQPGGNSFEGAHTLRVYNLLGLSPIWTRVPVHEHVLPIVERVLDPGCLVSSLSSIRIQPGETAQPIHADDQLLPIPRPHPAIVCNTMWALTDFTEENGATHVLPGSSAVDDEEGLKLPGGQAAMRRGSVLFYDGKVLHGGGANRSNSVRRGVNITYSVGWVRQEENQYLACPIDVARTLDDDLLRMMGYQQGAFAMGYVGDQQDPLSFLRGGDAKTKLIRELDQKSGDHRQFVDELDQSLGEG